MLRTALRFAIPSVLTLTLATPALAQGGGAPASLRVAPSGRATTAVELAAPRAEGQPRSAPLRVAIDYGQPHARGRKVVGGLIPADGVWRTGANAATTLTTDVDLMIGGTRVPKGSYTLFTVAGPGGSKLIINKQTGQWGTEYKPDQDLARVDLTARTLREPVESFTIWLVPDAQGASGTLRMAWGERELSAPWRVAQ
jgi:hypothetical protein